MQSDVMNTIENLVLLLSSAMQFIRAPASLLLIQLDLIRLTRALTGAFATMLEPARVVWSRVEMLDCYSCTNR